MCFDHIAFVFPADCAVYYGSGGMAGLVEGVLADSDDSSDRLRGDRAGIGISRKVEAHGCGIALPGSDRRERQFCIH